MPTSRPTIADVARRANVSIATVSRVLNQTVPVDEAMAERVHAAVAELNYIPHAAARTLASRKTDALGLLLPEISGEFFQPMLRGVEAAASEMGYDLLIHATRPAGPGSAARRPLGEHNTDGLLAFTGSLDENELARLHGIGFPIILIHQTPPRRIRIPTVTIENRQGSRMIIEHLIVEHGCTRIAFLRGPEGNEDALARELGYRDALEKHGLSFEPSLVGEGGFSRDTAFRTVRDLQTRAIPFDAIAGADDESAIGAILALGQLGQKIPDQISVVGFDDTPPARTLTPELTTVHAPTEQVGREAVHQLVHLIHGEKIEPCLVLPVQLVIRRSCGCPANHLEFPNSGRMGNNP